VPEGRRAFARGAGLGLAMLCAGLVAPARADDAAAPGVAPREAAAAPAQAAPEQAPHPTAAHPGTGTSAHGQIFQPPPDQILPDAQLPAGTIAVEVRDAEGKPVSGTEVRLGVLFQSIAEGAQSTFKVAKTDGAGRTRFGKLSTDSSHSYRVTVRHAGADYASAPFNLKEDAGFRVVLHVYPVTHDARGTFVWSRCFVHIEPRDDVFQWQVLCRLFNLSRITWVPQGVAVRLPEGWKAFEAQDDMTDTRFVADDAAGAVLTGTFSPGQHSAGFRFQTPHDHSETASFVLSALPRTAELRVLTSASPRMTLDVEGFEETRQDVGNDGQRMLVTRWMAQSADQGLGDVRIHLRGLPTPGMGRWWALTLAVGIAAAGMFLSRSPIPAAGSETGERKQARQRLLDELVELEQAHTNGELGPRAYERMRGQLVDALARLELTPTRAA